MIIYVRFLWIFVQFSISILQSLSDQTQPDSFPSSYGAPSVVGEALEPCDDEHSIAQATLLSPEDEWEKALVDDAKPGDVFLLREGIYQADNKLWLPAGRAGAPLIIKPYNCAAVTLHSSLRPNSYNIIAGIRLEATGIGDTKWAIRFDGKNRDPLTTIVVRNNTIIGGTIDAIRVNDDVRNIAIQGNHIDGGRDGHNIFVTTSKSRTQLGNILPDEITGNILPDEITITQNRLTKQYFSSASEDMFQVRDVGMVRFTHNTCADGYNMEQCVDIKTTTVPLLIAYNFFDGDTLHQMGGGKDGAGGCMVIHEDDSVADQHFVEHNYFQHCQGTVIRFAPGNGNTTSSARFQYNVLAQQQGQQQIIPIEMASDVLFEHNTILYGVLKLGKSGQSRLPRNLILKHNIFYQTQIEDNLLPPDVVYTCAYNLLYQLTGTGFTAAPCDHTITDDPRFVNLALEDLHLQSVSPALNHGENGTTVGALSIEMPTVVLDKQIFLPLMVHVTTPTPP